MALKLARNLLLVTLISCSSGVVYALSFGEISVSSSLGQPLNAQIELVDIESLDNSMISVQLASVEDFEKVGVARNIFLSNLKFVPMLSAGSKSTIRVTSIKPVQEPYLNFLIKVTLPWGSLLREYTLLIDPPDAREQFKYATVQLSEKLATPSVGENPAQIKQEILPKLAPKLAQQDTRISLPKPVIDSAVRRAEFKNEYKTVRGDTLSQISVNARKEGSLNQVMLAIQDLNPEAFEGGNINNLKSGYVLSLPTQDQIYSRTAKDVAYQVASQAQSWRKDRYVFEPQLDATQQKHFEQPEEVLEQQDTLKLVVAEKKAEQNNATELAEANSINQLAVAQEILDTARSESDELKARVADLEVQLNKLLELKNTQLAALNKEVLLAKSEQKSNEVAQTAVGSDEVQKALDVAQEVGQKKAAALHQQESTAQAEGVSLVAKLIKNAPMYWTVFAVGVALLVLLLGVMLVLRKKQIRISVKKEAQDENKLLDDTRLQYQGTTNQKDLAIQDLIEEVNLILRSGNAHKALRLLSNGMLMEPASTELQLKKLDVLGQLCNGQGFLLQLQKLENTGTDEVQAKLAEIKAKYPGLVPVSSNVIGTADSRTGLEAPQPESNLVPENTANTLDFSPATEASSNTMQPEQRPSLNIKEFNTPEVDFDLDLNIPDPKLESIEKASFQSEIKSDDIDAEGLSFLSSIEDSTTKLDLARAYIDMGDIDGARELLDEVSLEGNVAQKQQAQELINQLG